MFPSMYVELTSLCNMACDFCGNKFMERKRGHMDFALFTGIVDQIAENNLTKDIKLATIGESLLYPKMFEAIKYCRGKKIVTSIITNGLLLTEDLYQKLADLGLREIQISLHDLTQESFIHRYANPGIDYTVFLKNIIRLIDYHVSHKITSSLLIDLMFCKEELISSQLWDFAALKENTKNAVVLLQPFIDEMRKIAGKNRIKCFLNKQAIRAAIRSLDIFNARLLKIMDGVYLNMISLNPQLYNTRSKLSGPLGSRIKLVKKTRGGCCNSRVPMILSDGSFIPCCQDVLSELIMGKIDSKTRIVSVINGAGYQNLIKGFRKKRVINPVCQECLGHLEYKNKFLQFRYLITSFDLYGRILAIAYAGKQLVRKICRDQLPEQTKVYIKGMLEKIGVY